MATGTRPGHGRGGGPGRGDRVAASPAPTGTALAALSDREIEVLSLVAAGRTNVEIAGDLVLSVRTVENHVSHIYRKLNVRNRVQATTFAAAHGLVAPDA